MKWTFIDNSDFIEAQFSKREKGYWIVWLPGSGEPQRKHESCIEARNEAKRLAESNPGKQFIVLHTDSAYSISKQEAIFYH